MGATAGLTCLQGHLPLTWASSLCSLPGALSCACVAPCGEGLGQGVPSPLDIAPVQGSSGGARFSFPWVTGTASPSFSESDSDLEPVGAGLQHLQQLSQELDEAIVAEER